MRGQLTQSMYHELRRKYLRERARRKLISQYEYVQEVNRIMEEYMTGQLLRGGSDEFMKKGRADLAKVQQELKVNGEFIAFLRKL